MLRNDTLNKFAKDNGAVYLFESSHKKQFIARGIRKILAHYTTEAGIQASISPNKLRQFLFTWMKKQGIDDAFIQNYSGHETQQALKIFSKLSLLEAQDIYNKVIEEFPV